MSKFDPGKVSQAVYQPKIDYAIIAESLLSHAYRSVSSFRIAATLARNCRKSPAKFPDIPVFGRLFAETDFDLHWAVGVAGGAWAFSERRQMGRPRREVFSSPIISSRATPPILHPRARGGAC